MDTARTEGWDREQHGRRPGDGPRIRAPKRQADQPRDSVQGRGVHHDFIVNEHIIYHFLVDDEQLVYVQLNEHINIDQYLEHIKYVLNDQFDVHVDDIKYHDIHTTKSGNDDDDGADHHDYWGGEPVRGRPRPQR